MSNAPIIPEHLVERRWCDPPPTPPITEDKFKFNSPCVCENNDNPCLCDDYGPQEEEEEKKFIATFCWICCKKNPNTPTEADLKKMIWVCDNEDCKKVEIIEEE